MTLKPKKPASKILIHVGVRKFSGAQIVEEWDSSHGPSIKLADKISEYIMRIGDSNSLCLNIVIQLLSRGKVRVDFRDTSERLELINQSDKVSRPEALMVFDHWIAENRFKPELPDATQKIFIEMPLMKLPQGR
jgi:hypothetical protein